MFAFVQTTMTFLFAYLPARKISTFFMFLVEEMRKIIGSSKNVTISTDHVSQIQRVDLGAVEAGGSGAGVAPANDPRREKILKEKFKVACMIIIPVSGGSLVGVLAGVMNSDKSSDQLTHKPFFLAYNICVYLSFLSCAAVMLMHLLRSYIRPVLVVVEIFLWTGLVTFIYAPILAVCLVVPMRSSLMVLSLLSPSIPFLIILLMFLCNLPWRGRGGHI